MGAQTASRRRRIARGAGRSEVDVTNMIGTFSGMRSKMQSLSKMMKMGGGGGARRLFWLPHQALFRLQNRHLVLGESAALQTACQVFPWKSAGMVASRQASYVAGRSCGDKDAA